MLSALLCAVIGVPAEAGPRLELAAFAARPLALATGLARGGSIQGRTQLGPMDLGVRLRSGVATENDLVFEVSHTELGGGVFLGYTHRAGLGEVGLGLVAEAHAVLESRTRHQADRFSRTDLELGSESWAFGGSAGLELGMRVHVAGPWSLGVAGGPTLVRVGRTSTRLSWVGSTSIGLDL